MAKASKLSAEEQRKLAWQSSQQQGTVQWADMSATQKKMTIYNKAKADAEREKEDQRRRTDDIRIAAEVEQKRKEEVAELVRKRKEKHLLARLKKNEQSE